MSADAVITLFTTISGIACVAIILVCFIKILNGEEPEARIYTKRIKYALLAFAFILMVTTISGIVRKYFDDSNVGIGTLDSSYTGQDTSIFSGGGEFADKYGRKIVIATHEGYSFALVLTDTKQLKEASIWTLFQQSILRSTKGIDNVYVWKLYSDCQRGDKGKNKPIYFYSFTTDFNDTETGRLYYAYSFNENFDDFLYMNEICYNALTSNDSNYDTIEYYSNSSASDLVKVLETYCNSDSNRRPINFYGYASSVTMYESGSSTPSKTVNFNI